MGQYVITIARQFGSLGRPIAKSLAEKLNIKYYDRDIVEKTQKMTGLPVPVISDTEESVGSKYYSMKFPLGNDNAMQAKIFNAQRDIILTYAEQESCIFVGRCSDYIIENTDFEHLSIYIYAPYEKKMENCVKSLFMAPGYAKKMIGEVDKARNEYHMHYAKYPSDDINHKDLLINSAVCGVEGTADFIKYIVEQRFGRG